jgi:hypothetical protein
MSKHPSISRLTLAATVATVIDAKDNIIETSVDKKGRENGREKGRM